MITTTRFDEIAIRSRRSRVRDAAFALLVAGMVAMGISSVRAATQTAETAHTPTVQTATIAANSVCDATHIC